MPNKSELEQQVLASMKSLSKLGALVSTLESMQTERMNKIVDTIERLTDQVEMLELHAAQSLRERTS